MRGVTLISIVLAPSLVYSFSSEALDDQDSIPVAIDFQEAFDKTSSFVGAILNRADGTSCGLIVENGTPLSSTGSVGSHSPALALKEELRQALAQNNIPLCPSAEDFQMIAQADLSKIDLDQIVFEGDSVQVAGLGKFLFSSPLRTALTSIAGTCLFTAMTWSVVVVAYNLAKAESSVQIYSIPPGLVREAKMLLVSLVMSGVISSYTTTAITDYSKVFKGELGKTGKLYTRRASFLGGAVCHFLGRYPTVMLLDSIVNLNPKSPEE